MAVPSFHADIRCKKMTIEVLAIFLTGVFYCALCDKGVYWTFENPTCCLVPILRILSKSGFDLIRSQQMETFGKIALKSFAHKYTVSYEITFISLLLLLCAVNFVYLFSVK